MNLVLRLLYVAPTSLRRPRLGVLDESVLRCGVLRQDRRVSAEPRVAALA